MAMLCPSIRSRRYAGGPPNGRARSCRIRGAKSVEIPPSASRMRVIGPVRGLIDGKRPFEASARLVQVAEIVQEDAKVAERDCHLRVVRPIRGLEYRKNPLLASAGAGEVVQPLRTRPRLPSALAR